MNEISLTEVSVRMGIAAGILINAFLLLWIFFVKKHQGKQKK